MKEKPRLMAVSPHPDDETFFWGGTLASLAGRGVDVRVLALSNGEQGRIPIFDGSGDLLNMRYPDPVLDYDWGGIRQRQSQEIIEAWGGSVKFLGFPDGGIDEKLIYPLKKEILDYDPHVIISFSEAGTSAHRDHIRSALVTFTALNLILNEYRVNFSAGENMELPFFPHAFIRYLTYHMPKFPRLKKFGEITDPKRKKVAIDVTGAQKLRYQSARAYTTQPHLVRYFDEIGLFHEPKDFYHERVAVGGLAENVDDLFRVIDPNRGLYIDQMPGDEEDYTLSDPLLYQNMREFAETVASSVVDSSRSSTDGLTDGIYHQIYP